MARVVRTQGFFLERKVASSYFSAEGIIDKRQTLIFIFEDNRGVVGVGECLCAGQTPGASLFGLAREVVPMILGEEIDYPRKVVGRIKAAVGEHSASSMMNVIVSGIDIALWDINGKASGRSVCELLGGDDNRYVDTYATGFYPREGMSRKEAALIDASRCRDAGFKAIKIKVGFGLVDDIMIVRTVRDIVGDTVEIFVDANCGYSRRSAWRLIRELADVGVYFLEEPLSRDDLGGYRWLSRRPGAVAIAAGEGWTPSAAWLALKQRSVDVYQPDVTFCGGFSSAALLSEIADLARVSVMPHVWGTEIALGVGREMVSWVNTRQGEGAVREKGVGWSPAKLEWDISENPIRDELGGGVGQLKNGRLVFERHDGIGVDVDIAYLSQECVASFDVRR